MTMQTDAFVVRPLTLDDLDALLPLVEALHTGDGDPFDPQRTVDALQLVLSHPEYGVVHVAVVEETIAGYIVGSLGLSIEAGGRFLLVDELYISPAWREQGLARALLASLIPYAQSHHCRVVELEATAPSGVPGGSIGDCPLRLGAEERHPPASVAGCGGCAPAGAASPAVAPPDRNVASRTRRAAATGVSQACLCR